MIALSPSGAQSAPMARIITTRMGRAAARPVARTSAWRRSQAAATRATSGRAGEASTRVWACEGGEVRRSGARVGTSAIAPGFPSAWRREGRFWPSARGVGRRWAEAAAARRLDRQPGAWPQGARRLGLELLAVQEIAPGRPRGAALGAWRRMPAALGEERERHLLQRL